MKLSKISYAVMAALSITFSAHSFAVEIVDKGTSLPSERDTVDSNDADSPWSRRMEDVTGLFGVKLKGSATSTGGGLNASDGFNTFQPWQQSSFEAVGAYGSTHVGFGCDGMNLGSIIDGQLGQYAGMVEEFIAQAPTLAIMYLAYSQPAVKSVIDELNMVGQFGLDLSNMTCSGVRNLADRSHEEKMQAVAEADCTANAGFKDPKCMAGDGIQESLISVMSNAKNTVTARASSLMGTVSSATGGFIKPRSATSGTGAGGTGTGTGGTGTGTGAPGTPTALPGKSCVDVDPADGTTPLILGASEMNCKDIKKYAKLLPTFIIQDDGSEEVKPRAVSIEKMSKQITEEHMGLMKAVYESDPNTFTTTPEYKNLVNRADIVISREELLFMKELALKSPGQAQLAIQQLSTLSMLKELEIIAAKVEAGVYSGLANQADQQYLSDRKVNQYGNSISLMRKEIDLVRAKIQADRERSMALQSIANSMGK